jgi:hypothetical protein
MPRLPLTALLLASSCASSAPYTLGAAAINTAVAVGASAAERASGGCYATCTNGTVCNAQTGLCETRKMDQSCEEAPGGGMRCLPVDVRGMTRQGQAGATAPPVRAGVSPATGSAPPPPSEASPREP